MKTSKQPPVNALTEICKTHHYALQHNYAVHCSLSKSEHPLLFSSGMCAYYATGSLDATASRKNHTRVFELCGFQKIDVLVHPKSGTIYNSK